MPSGSAVNAGRQMVMNLGYENRLAMMGFGNLDVQSGMRPVSDFRKARGNRPFTIMPFGPPQPWLEKGPEAAQSTAAFGNSLRDKYVNPSGYLSTWYGQPRVIPASWNPLLLQGNNIFREGIDNPTLSQVMFGRPKGKFFRKKGRRNLLEEDTDDEDETSRKRRSPKKKKARSGKKPAKVPKEYGLGRQARKNRKAAGRKKRKV